jgi:hypothetical protein
MLGCCAALTTSAEPVASALSLCPAVEGSRRPQQDQTQQKTVRMALQTVSRSAS